MKKAEKNISEKIKVLVVGPDSEKAKGGMSSVIKGMQEDRTLRSRAELSFFPSYRDGALIKRMCYCLYRLLCFFLVFGKYDLIHIHMAADGSAYRKALYARIAMLRRKKVIVHVHGSRFQTFLDELPVRRLSFLKKTLQQADLVLALSEGWKKILSEKLSLHNCEVLPNGIDTERLASACRDKNDEKVVFLFLGRIGKRKGAYDLLKVWDRIRRTGGYVKCIMAGDGEVEKMRQCAEEMGLSGMLEIPGWVDETGKLQLFRETDVLLLPSYHEGMPMAILEAMAAGKAIICTGVGGIPETVENGINGILIKPGDLEALYLAVKRLAEDRELCRKMGTVNHEKAVALYDRKMVHEKLYRYYCRVTGKGAEV